LPWGRLAGLMGMITYQTEDMDLPTRRDANLAQGFEETTWIRVTAKYRLTPEGGVRPMVDRAFKFDVQRLGDAREMIEPWSVLFVSQERT
jgi:hypothetical protein